jgi:hypothetical protein
MSEHIAEASNLLDALRDLAARLPAEAEALTVTGVRRDGMWRVQGSIPIQRQPVFQGYETCGCLTNDAGIHRGQCPDYQTHIDGNGRRYWMRRTP